ncbi:hypothetical protein SAMN05421881_11131, partial [Nitrosomonas halophila]
EYFITVSNKNVVNRRNRDGNYDGNEQRIVDLGKRL